MEAGDLLIRGAQVLTLDPTAPDLPRGDILIRDGAIVAIGAQLEATAAEVLEAERMVAMPGFVDTHWHLWNSILRGAVSGDTSVSYMALKARYGPQFQPPELYRSVRLGLAEGIDCGVTTVHDWAHYIRRAEDAEVDLQALEESGIRARFAYGAPSTAQGLSVEQMAAAMTDIFPVARVMDFATIERLSQRLARAPAGRITMGVNLRGPARSTPEVYRAEWHTARELGLPIAMHCAGTEKETHIIHQATILAEEGLLGPDVLLAHGNYLTSDEIAALARHGVSLSISPLGELRGGATMAHVSEVHAAGITVGLSCDTTTMASADMFVTMRLALETENARQGNGQALTPRRVLEMATIEGARALGLQDITGSLRPGKRADILLIRTDDLNLAPIGDLEAALVHAGQPRNIDTVLVDGQRLKSAGKLVGLDPATVVAEAQEALATLGRRLAGTAASA